MPVELTINPKFSAHIAKQTPFVSGGLRTYREYRDLGAAEASGGKVHAHIVRTTAPCPPEGSGVHYHDLDFQMVYVLKGSSRVWFEGEGEFSFEAGDSWIQPPSIRHHVLDYSEDYELLEITMPGSYETVQLPDEKGPAA
jgi:quercetin dioxygenase-like cupin family protein